MSVRVVIPLPISRIPWSPKSASRIPWSYEVERTALAARGVELIVPDTDEEAAAAMRDADVIFTSSAITAADIATFERAVGIVCYSVGMDYVDAKAAAARGIEVRNCPTANNEEVSDHAVLLILAAERRLLPLAVAAAAGDWDIRGWPMLGAVNRMSTRTIGIIGLGRIGHHTARKLGGFRSTLIAYDPYIEGSRDPNVTLVGLDELAARSDIVVSCAALTDTSRGIIGRDFLSKTKRGVLIVNVSRGGVVDETALADALESGQVAYAALDVRSPEPPDPAHDRLTSQPGVLLTQHIAGLSVQAFEELHHEAAREIIRLLEDCGRLPRHRG